MKVSQKTFKNEAEIFESKDLITYHACKDPCKNPYVKSGMRYRFPR